ncbi:MAG: GIY-YIG nuclease family protein [Muribaculaceae bacterium]|nr:GIY-YIG nuclease family protein [Muribaculaceae bacterium]
MNLNSNNIPKSPLEITTIQDILSGRNSSFDASKAIKLIRHADTRSDDVRTIDGEAFEGTLYELYRYDKEKFMQYQRSQRKGTFDKTEYLVVFIGEKGTTARFIAVYKVGAMIQNPKVENEWVIDLQEVEEFKFLSHRIVIDWGKAVVSWHQDYRKNLKYVIRIDEGFEDENGVPRFISYNDTLLSYDELKAIFTHSDEDWKNVLQAVNCIYLIQDKLTGKQYVGSTYGNKGIWGRWEEYFKSGGHGAM